MSAPAPKPWLTVIGIGDDGLNGLGESARAAVAEAEMFIGGERHLSFLPEDERAKILWPSPLLRIVEKIQEYRGKKVCVLASGDPFFYGIGVTLAKHFSIKEMRIYPAPSSLSWALARLGWSFADVKALTLHGRPLEGLKPYLSRRARLVALSEDRQTPQKVAAMLCEAGFGPSVLHVFSNLGSERETHLQMTADEMASRPIPESLSDLNVLAFELVAGGEGLGEHFLPGLDDDRFRHDGQLTKREIRILTLAALEPRPRDLLWDIGAGSGSISIEWLRAHESLQAVAVETNDARIDNIRRNMKSLGAPRLEVVHGLAPDCLADLPDPDAVFIGGGLSAPDLLETCWSRLKEGGRLVANAVTLTGESLLISFAQKNSGRLTRLSIQHAAQLGRFERWRPLTPITQLKASKPRRISNDEDGPDP